MQRNELGSRRKAEEESQTGPKTRQKKQTQPDKLEEVLKMRARTGVHIICHATTFRQKSDHHPFTRILIKEILERNELPVQKRPSEKAHERYDSG